MKQFQGTCVDNPFRTLDRLNEVIDGGKEISRAMFVAQCNINTEGGFLRDLMKEYPRDYVYYKSIDGIYFYTWSAIEHFFWGS